LFQNRDDLLFAVSRSFHCSSPVLGLENSHSRWSSFWGLRHSGLFIVPDKRVQETFTEIANHVMNRYDKRQTKAAEFLKGGDAWIIAHAKCDGGMVVTQESRLDATALIPKIPNVSRSFDVGCINLPSMLTRLKFRFGK